MKKKLTIYLALAIVNMITLVIFTYAWFLFKDPVGELSNIRVFTGDYTYISTHPDHGFNPILDFNDIIVDDQYLSDQNLIPVSSYNGYEFDEKYGLPYNHPELVGDRAFLEFDIYLITNTARYIYLAEGSAFEDPTDSSLSNAMRVSFTTYSDDEEGIREKTIIWEHTNDGLGTYGEHIYDTDYPDLSDDRFQCYSERNTEGAYLCPSQQKKDYYNLNTFGNEMLIPFFPPGPEDEPEDLTDVPIIMYLEEDMEVGRRLTIRVWLEGFDPDAAYLFDITDENIKIDMEFTMSLYFTSRRLDEI